MTKIIEETKKKYKLTEEQIKTGIALCNTYGITITPETINSAIKTFLC